MRDLCDIGVFFFFALSPWLLEILGKAIHFAPVVKAVS